MKPYPAIATLEFTDIALGMYTTDAMVKKAPIAMLKCGTISPGRYLTLIGGSTAAVAESYEEGRLVGGAGMIDHLMLPDVNPQLFDGLLGKRQPTQGEALGVLETATVSSNFRAAEAALKETAITLVEIRFADPLLSGKAVSIFHGILHDIQAAVNAAVDRSIAFGAQISHKIITAPHSALFDEVNQHTVFHEGKPLSLDGETG